MRNPTLIPVFLVILAVTGCSRQAYYVSPLQGSVTPYHTIPLASDSIVSSTYISGRIGRGSANDGLSDGVFIFQLNGYRTHQLGLLQAYYGADISAGTYHVTPFHSSEYERFSSFLDTAKINAAGRKSYGSAGIHGGLNVIMPFGRGHEWRIGAQTALNKDFGSYLQFRRSLRPDSVDGVAKSSILAALSFQTELAFRLRHGSFNLKWELGQLLGKDYRDTYFGKRYGSGSRFAYWSFTLQRAINRTGIFTQITAGSQTLFFHWGVNYRLQGSHK